MGALRIPEPVLLFFGLLGAGEEALVRARARLEDEFGPAPVLSPVIPFTFSAYYEPEMGAGLLRQWALTGRLIAPDAIAAIKRRTNEIEEEFCGARETEAGPAGGRRANIDPGYVSLAKVVLATTKDYSHRLYLGGGIYAEVTLAYGARTRGFEPQPWTYPDYRAPAALDFFNRAREEYKRLMRQARAQETGHGATL